MGIARASGGLGRSPTDWWRRPRSSPLKPASATQAQAYKRRALPPSQVDTPLAHRDTIQAVLNPFLQAVWRTACDDWWPVEINFSTGG